MLIEVAGKAKSLKSEIFFILGSQKSLTARKIYAWVKKAGFNVSYHAVYKTLKRLLNDGVLEKINKEYNINQEWLSRTKQFLGRMETKNDESKPSAEKLLSGNVSNVSFDNLFEFFDYMIEFFTKFASRGDRILYSHWYHLYWALSFEGERFTRFKNMTNSFKQGYFLCRGNTEADKIIYRFYTSFNPIGRVKYGIDCAQLCDTFVCDDCVAQVFFERKLKEKLDRFYRILDPSNQKSIRKLMETLFFAKTNITLVVTKNNYLAEQIKKETVRYFT